MNRRARASSPPVIDEEHRSTRKRRAILEAATSLFLRQGYLGTSMDEIAALAAVSKQTVYKHFADKGHLFSEIVTSTVNEASDTVYDEVRNLQDSGDLEADIVANTQKFTAVIEDYVRRYPEQWLWVHRRWKTRPEGDPPLY